jgi:hypothetical protein
MSAPLLPTRDFFAGKSVGSGFQATFSLQIIGQVDLRMSDVIGNTH